MNLFKHRHFQYDIIIWAVRWYCKYGISYRELEEMLCQDKQPTVATVALIILSIFSLPIIVNF